MREQDTIAISAASNPQLLNQFILQNEYFILKYASTISHRYISKSDDEWSVALYAFTQAVHEYDLTRGSFYKFAKLIISRRLIDYFRKENKYNSEISIDPIIFDSEPNEGEHEDAYQLEVIKKVSVIENSSLKLEIDAINIVFSNYGFSFFDLTSCSPKAKKTKKSCAKAIAYLLYNTLLVTELRTSKQLPLTIIEKNTKVPRKILERHRKYIIAAVEILSGEYLLLADYLWYIKEEIKLLNENLKL